MNGGDSYSDKFLLSWFLCHNHDDDEYSRHLYLRLLHFLRQVVELVASTPATYGQDAANRVFVLHYFAVFAAAGVVIKREIPNLLCY